MMAVVFTLAVVAALVLMGVGAARLGAARLGLTPLLAGAVIGLPLLDSSLRHLGLPLFFPGCGYLLLAAGVWAAWRHHSGVAWPRWALFALVLLVALLLRGIAPGFDSFGENIFSLRYVQSLRLSTTYPAADLWGASPTVATYYTLIHNLPALLSRALFLPVPFAFSLSIALILACLWMVLFDVMRGRQSAGVAALLATVAVSAGTGVSLLLWAPVHPGDSMMLGYPHVRLFDMRPDEFSWPWLSALVARTPALPVESPLHIGLYLGDLHPPLFSLMLMALLLWVWASRDRGEGGTLYAGFLGALPWLAWASNPWTIPHFGLLAVGLFLFDPAARRHWHAALAGLLLSWVLVMPLVLNSSFLDGVGIRALPASLRAPWPALLIIWGPALLLTIAAVVQRVRTRWVMLAVTLLAASMEFVHFSQGDDAGSGARFNGVLKVWSPLHFLLLGLGLYVMAALRGRLRVLWLLAVPVVVSATLHGRDVMQAQLNKGQVPLQWNGADRLHQRNDRAFLLRALQGQPRGRTMERPERYYYTLAPLTSQLAGHATVSGWPHHAAQASGDAPAEQRRLDAIQGWYAGSDRRPRDLLDRWDVDTVLVDWDAGWDAQRLHRLRISLGSGWAWIPGPDAEGGTVSGLLVRAGADKDNRK